MQNTISTTSETDADVLLQVAALRRVVAESRDAAQLRWDTCRPGIENSPSAHRQRVRKDRLGPFTERLDRI